jgi:hypothetical protein
MPVQRRFVCDYLRAFFMRMLDLCAILSRALEQACITYARVRVWILSLRRA